MPITNPQNMRSYLRNGWSRILASLSAVELKIMMRKVLAIEYNR
jgi:hypothetical protein